MSLALVAVTRSDAAEVFPVVHNEPITIRILGGKDGRPLARLHLTLIAGYDQADMREQMFREEVLTDAHGQVRLSNQLTNLPWLQVWVGKKSLCQYDAPRASFSVELMRRDGLSTPNRCGKATVEDTPGVFNVFVKGKGAAPAPSIKSKAPSFVAVAATPPAATPVAGATATVAGPLCSCSCPKKSRRCGPACKGTKAVGRGVAWYLR
jgi:hypothetical protein